MTAFTDVANPRRLIKSLRLTLCTWDTVRSEPSGRRTSPVDLSLMGRDALQRATEGALSVRLRLVVEPVDLEAARFEHGFQESAPIADTVKGPGPFATIALWINRDVGDALFREGGEEEAPVRCEEPVGFSTRGFEKVGVVRELGTAETEFLRGEGYFRAAHLFILQRPNAVEPRRCRPSETPQAYSLNTPARIGSRASQLNSSTHRWRARRPRSAAPAGSASNP